MDKYEFDRKFRLKLIALCLDDSWMVQYGNFIIQPSYFESDDEELLVQTLLDYRQKYRHSPKDSADVLALMGPEYKDVVEYVFKGCKKWDLSLASDLALQFAREQAVKLAILESVDDVMAGKLEAPVERVKTAIQVGRDLGSPGLDPIADTQWLYDLYTDKVPTLWTHVDNELGGGLSAGEEMGIILAPMNRGKTMALINIAYGAASIAGHRNVIYMSHEMSQRKIAKRFAARIMFRFPTREDSPKRYATQLVEAAHRLLVGQIRIVGGPEKMSYLDVEHSIERLIDEGFEPGIIIDDYLDDVEPIHHRPDRRFELAELYRWYRSLAPRYGCAMWTASQSNRDSFSKEIITMADIAEDITKAAIADVIIGLCQTREEEGAEVARLYMAKVRDGDSRAEIQAKFHKHNQTIITTGYVDRRQEGTSAN